MQNGGRGGGHPDWRTLALSINDRPVSPQITQCLVSDRNIPSVVVAQGDVMLIPNPEVLKDSVASTAIRCLQISCGPRDGKARQPLSPKMDAA